MPMHYTNPTREADPDALPDLEVFYHDTTNALSYFQQATDEGIMESGWYYWACFPGCLPDSDPAGPFATEAEALADARVAFDDEEA